MAVAAAAAELTVAETVVMLTTSYPRFRGDSVGTFMEPIATGVAARGHEVHVVAPWHPLIERPRVEHGVHFHFYRYAPIRSMNVFGYAAAMNADVSLRRSAYVAAPLALTAGLVTAWHVARKYRATVMHGHWVVPGGVTAAAAAPKLPLVISLHGSDVFVAERLAPARHAARLAFGRAAFVTACSADLALRAIALGANVERTLVIPYGVDPERFKPNRASCGAYRDDLSIAPNMLLVAAAGRLVKKKGFEYLIDAVAQVPHAFLVIAGDGTLRDELRERAASAGIAPRTRFLGEQTQDDVARLFAAADVIAVPSVRDDAGNVDGLPNVLLEALATGRPLVTTDAGGIGAVVRSGVNAILVPQRDAGRLADALRRLDDPSLREALGQAARQLIETEYGWGKTAEQFEDTYRRALAFKARRR